MIYVRPQAKLLFLVLNLSIFGVPAMWGDNVDPASANAVPSIPEITSQGYQLAFSDEFNGTALDETKWLYRIDSKGLSSQLPANVSVSDGVLHLHVNKEAFHGKDYTGSGIISKAEFQYGYYEARFKVPPGAGWHTSFWAQHYNLKDTNPKGAAQELDFCEQDSGNHAGYSTGLFAWGSTLKEKSLGRIWVKTPDLAKDYHVWGAEFTPGVVRMYFDGKLVNTIDATTFAHGPQNIWLTVLGLGKGIDDGQLPSEAEFDYVRFFTKK